MNTWSCYDARPFGRASPPPGGNCPGIEAVVKRSDVQRGIEPVYHFWRPSWHRLSGQLLPPPVFSSSASYRAPPSTGRACVRRQHHPLTV
jgi:hypothetical protein